MAENDNVLGISGQMDISDIQSTIDKLCSTLQRVGVETDALSERMTKALNDIAKSDGDISTKTQQAMSILKEAMDEAKKDMEDVSVMRDIQEQGLNQLTRIEQNTRPISGMADDISDIKRMVKDNS